MLLGFARWSVAELVLVELVLFRSLRFASLTSLRSAHVTSLRLWHSFVLWFGFTLSGVPQLHLLGGIFQDQFHVWTIREPVNTFTGNRQAQYAPFLEFYFQLWGVNISTHHSKILSSKSKVLGGGIWRAYGRLMVGSLCWKNLLLCQKCFSCLAWISRTRSEKHRGELIWSA